MILLLVDGGTMIINMMNQPSVGHLIGTYRYLEGCAADAWIFGEHSGYFQYPIIVIEGDRFHFNLRAKILRFDPMVY